jgi:hypothetical protein
MPFARWESEQTKECQKPHNENATAATMRNCSSSVTYIMNADADDDFALTHNDHGTLQQEGSKGAYLYAWNDAMNSR